MEEASQLVDALRHKDAIIRWNNDYQQNRVVGRLNEIEEDQANASISDEEEEDFLSVRYAG